MIGAAYLAPEGLEATLEEELRRLGASVERWHRRLALSPEPPVPSIWALDIWTSPREIAIASVKDAADALRAMQRNWSAYGVSHHRRMALIADRLPPVKARALRFPEPAPASHLGAWTLLAPRSPAGQPGQVESLRQRRVRVRAGPLRARRAAPI